MKETRLFVTGICGRLGRALTAEATAQGLNVVGLDRIPWPDTVERPEGVEIHTGTLEDEELLDQLMEKSTHFIHTAGLHGENLQDHGLPDFLRSNVESVACLIEKCLKNNIRNICLSSSMEVLVGRDYRASGAAVLDDDAPLRTDSAYSLSKALMETLAQEISHQRDVSITVLRYMAFGYRTNERLGLGLLSRYLSSEDAARAAIRAVFADGMKGEIFHIGPKSPLTNSDILQALKSPGEVLEKYYPGSVEVVERAGHKLSPEMFWPVVSIEKARRLLGWEPQYTFESWLKHHGWPGVS